ncbi:BZ3500_MvSof-1268-A1-R1_Chr1-3g01567 [Microbotryum saponariae]|uniref:BZ3500_MvSof-1268-A1-R1_Chr1-3g01567 protein n=1 Tax=Microbotryum saponariae TaxID=289078 RepID=A0A2X0KAG3_9BASI|nr:BZ3500_MvSof-1268-A1-R1_Chr1-3g01567 [Microbotryum saponariae]SCZ94050.1 BZ3501_MvSof-1269-A2-R1_Chr1-3g01169 [Microbotryum saponariae]
MASTKAGKPITSRRTALYRTLHDQVDSSALSNALKTCDKLLRLDPHDELALQTRLQLLIALDRFTQAVTAIESAHSATYKPYCCYKLARPSETIVLVDDDGRERQREQQDDRTAFVLRAQALYRLERFEEARDLFEDLIASTDEASPEVIDLRANVDACLQHLAFVSTTVPNALSVFTAARLDQLENSPVPQLVHHKTNYSRPSASQLVAQAAPKKPRHRRPEHLAAASTPPDEDRWLPKRERAGAEHIRKKEIKRGKIKERLAMQGGTSSMGAAAEAGQTASRKADPKKKKAKGRK